MNSFKATYRNYFSREEAKELIRKTLSNLDYHQMENLLNELQLGDFRYDENSEKYVQSPNEESKKDFEEIKVGDKIRVITEWYPDGKAKVEDLKVVGFKNPEEEYQEEIVVAINESSMAFDLPTESILYKIS